MKKWTVSTFAAAKGVRKLGCCTAYDACFARLADEAGVPCILVGDSMGNNVLGYSNTLPVKMEEMLSATTAVARAVKTYASRRGMTIDAFVLEYLTRTASIERRTQKRKNPVLKFCGILAKGSADKILSAVAEQRAIDEDLWK